MKGFIKTLCGAGLLTGAIGCNWWGIESYSDLVDPCYPQRYNNAARQEVIGGVSPQMSNGHLLDQTLWNTYFEAGTDKLTPGGLSKLGQLLRRRPAPDPVIYLQTAQDIAYDPANPDRFIQAREELDKKRVGTVQKYLQAYAGPRGLSFQVLIHDPNEAGMSAVPAGQTVQRSNAGSMGLLPAGGSATASGGAGAAGGGAPPATGAR